MFIFGGRVMQSLPGLQDKYNSFPEKCFTGSDI